MKAAETNSQGTSSILKKEESGHEVRVKVRLGARRARYFPSRTYGFSGWMLFHKEYYTDFYQLSSHIIACQE